METVLLLQDAEGKRDVLSKQLLQLEMEQSPPGKLSEADFQQRVQNIRKEHRAQREALVQKCEQELQAADESLKQVQPPPAATTKCCWRP